jgi:hypothetical protein
MEASPKPAFPQSGASFGESSSLTSVLQKLPMKTPHRVRNDIEQERSQSDKSKKGRFWLIIEKSI